MSLTTAFFSEIERTSIKNISNAKSNLKIAVAWFINPTLYKVLSGLVDASKTVELIMADDIINFKNKENCFQKFIDKGVDIRVENLLP